LNEFTSKGKRALFEIAVMVRTFVLGSPNGSRLLVYCYHPKVCFKLRDFEIAAADFEVFDLADRTIGRTPKICLPNLFDPAQPN
jgi:hypothetical protein